MCEITTRPVGDVITAAVQHEFPNLFGLDMGSFTTSAPSPQPNPLVGKQTSTFCVYPESIASLYPQSSHSTLKITAMFNSRADIEPIVTEALNRCIRNSIPPPHVRVSVSIKHILTLQSGSFVRLTLGNYPTDPFNGDRGMTTQDALILSTKVDLRGGKLDLLCRLAPSITFGKIAPAANVSAKGTYLTVYYVTVNRNDFVGETDSDIDTDLMYFSLGQLLVLRDVNGVEQEDLGAIIGFGTGGAYHDTPVVTDTCIYFTASISRVIASGDYVTFDNWDGTVSGVSNMNLYSAYGSSTGALTGGATSKVYG
jgi:hypothetical protein